MSKVAIAVHDALIPDAQWRDNLEKGLSFHVDLDPKTGHYLYESVKAFPRAVMYDGEMYVFTGWNSDTGHVYYKTGRKIATPVR